jgi:hypothetical protein
MAWMKQKRVCLLERARRMIADILESAYSTAATIRLKRHIRQILRFPEREIQFIVMRAAASTTIDLFVSS